MPTTAPEMLHAPTPKDHSPADVTTDSKEMVSTVSISTNVLWAMTTAIKMLFASTPKVVSPANAETDSLEMESHVLMSMSVTVTIPAQNLPHAPTMMVDSIANAKMVSSETAMSAKMWTNVLPEPTTVIPMLPV